MAVQRADTILADEDTCDSILSSFLQGAPGLTQVFVEAQKHELATLNVEVHNKVVASLVETIVVDLTRLIQQNLLASSLDGSHDLLVVRGQVIHVKLLLLHKEEGGTDSDRCVSLFL